MRPQSNLTTVVITCKIQPGRSGLARQEFSRIVKTVVANESACHGIDLHIDPENDDRVLLIEYWDSKEAFTGPHMQTKHMQEFLTRAQNFIEGTPDFSFWEVIASAS